MTLRQLQEGFESEVDQIPEHIPLASISVEALVDMGNGIDNKCPLIDMIYNSRSNMFVLYVDGRNLEY